MKASKGFTIIELLVVIAIIAVLAAIIMANVISYRNKAKDSAIKGDMNSLPTAATLYFVNGSSDYTDICVNDNNFQRIRSAVQKDDGSLYCKSDDDQWVACSQLSSDVTTFWCIDNTGAKMITANSCDDYASTELYCH